MICRRNVRGILLLILFAVACFSCPNPSSGPDVPPEPIPQPEPEPEPNPEPEPEPNPEPEPIPHQNIDSSFWGSWLGIRGSAEWYIAGSSVRLGSLEQAVISSDLNSIQLTGGTIRKDSLNILTFTPRDSTIPRYLFRASGTNGRFSVKVVETSLPRSAQARSLSGIGGIQVIIENIENPEDQQSVETDENGEIHAEDIIVGDNYEISIPAQEGVPSEIEAVVTPLFDTQDLGVIDLFNENANFKMNLTTNHDMNELRADGSSYYDVTVHISNIGLDDMDEARYTIVPINGLTIKGETSDILGTVFSGATRSVSIQAMCPYIQEDHKDMGIRVEVTDISGTRTWTEDLSIRFLQNLGTFNIQYRSEQATIDGLVVTPEGTPYRLSNMDRTPLDFIPGDWYILVSGDGAYSETKYSIGIHTPARYDWDLFTDPAWGEPNNFMEEATLIPFGESTMQYLGAKDIDIFRFGSEQYVSLEFETNGAGYIPAAYRLSSGVFQQPDDPYQSGKIFGGWYLDAACTELFDFSQTVHGDTLLYASWVDEIQGDYKVSAGPEYGTLTLVSYQGNSSIVTLPGEFQNVPVVEIERFAFQGNSNLQTLHISQGIREIGDRAFEHCGLLTSVTFPDSLESIGGYSFSDCASLRSISGGNGLASIGQGAFENCTQLESITLPEGLHSIEALAFTNCDSLLEVSFPSSLNLIPYAVLRDCDLLERVVIPQGIQGIESEAFAYCARLKDTSMPSTLETIGRAAFRDCDSLTDFTFPGGLRSTGESVLYSCDSLERVVIEAGVQEIGPSSFGSCISLMNVSVPNTVKTIGNQAFSGCSAMVSLDISSVESMGNYAFMSCSELTTVTLGPNLHTIGDYAFIYCSKLDNVQLPQGLLSMGTGAFNDCRGMSSIEIPASLGRISASSFGNCTGLQSVTISQGITEIGYGAFTGCTLLERIDIPSSVLTLAPWAFSACTNLKEITLSQGLESIGANAFANTGILSIDLPASLLQIGDEAFDYCRALIDVSLLSPIPPGLGLDAFPSSNVIFSITVPQGELQAYLDHTDWAGYSGYLNESSGL